MNNKDPILFVEINVANYIFVAGKQDDNQNLKIIDKIIVPSVGINKNKFTDIDIASEVIKKNVELIETKLNFVFKDVITIVDNFEFLPLNISGYKKLNGSQILKENIFYIINSLKKEIIASEQQKTILHIFNSRSILDGENIENLPIGLFGDFYSHELTFFLIGNNDLKNIKQIFNKNNLEVKKVFIKNFCECIQLINENNVETFFKINIGNNNTLLSFFDQSSYKYSENFNFGTNIIIKDIAKICSIDSEIIETFLFNNFNKNNNFHENDYLEEEYFKKKQYRKIRKKLILEIVNARIKEIADIILNKNINISSFRKNVKIYIFIQDKLILDNFRDSFKTYFSKAPFSEISFINAFELDSLIANTASLSAYGWRKEAVPVIQTKNSLITRIFQTIFK